MCTRLYTSTSAVSFNMKSAVALSGEAARPLTPCMVPCIKMSVLKLQSREEDASKPDCSSHYAPAWHQISLSNVAGYQPLATRMPPSTLCFSSQAL